MSESKITFEFSQSVTILGGTATLSIVESSYVLPEKSLYGAGQTRHKTDAKITYNHSGDEYTVIYWNTPEKQSLLKTDFETSFEDQAKKIINKHMLGALLTGIEEDCD